MISAHDYQTNNFMTVHKSLELVPEATFALTKLLSNQIFERMDKGLEELLKRQSKLQFTLPLTTIIAFSADFGTSQWLWQQEEFQKEKARSRILLLIVLRPCSIAWLIAINLIVTISR